MGRVEVQAVEGEFGEVDGLGGDGGEDGVALGEEGVECPAQAVIVEAVGGDVPEEVSPGALGPGGDVDEGGGLAQPGGEQEAEDASVGESQLRIGWQVAVDEGGNVEPLEERCDEGQGAQGQSLVGEGRAVPGVRHRASAGNRMAGDARWQARSGTEMIGGRSSGRPQRKKPRRTTRQRRRGVESWGREGPLTAPHGKTDDHRTEGCGK